jgi:chloramphenicol 3-O phosphotransferase
VDAPCGRVIVLNGPSSSGKTSLAVELQARLASRGECWIILGIDDYLSRLPFAWVTADDHVGANAEDGIVLERVDGAIRWRIGPIGRQLFAAYRGAVSAAARSGLDVIVDEVVLDEDVWAGWQRELEGIDTLWVRVIADVTVLEARELARGDRTKGTARAQVDDVHRFGAHDVSVDTGVLTVTEAAGVILGARGSDDAL